MYDIYVFVYTLACSTLACRHTCIRSLYFSDIKKGVLSKRTICHILTHIYDIYVYVYTFKCTPTHVSDALYFPEIKKGVFNTCTICNILSHIYERCHIYLWYIRYHIICIWERMYISYTYMRSLIYMTIFHILSHIYERSHTYIYIWYIWYDIYDIMSYIYEIGCIYHIFIWDLSYIWRRSATSYLIYLRDLIYVYDMYVYVYTFGCIHTCIRCTEFSRHKKRGLW